MQQPDCYLVGNLYTTGYILYQHTGFHIASKPKSKCYVLFLTYKALNVLDGGKISERQPPLLQAFPEAEIFKRSFVAGPTKAKLASTPDRVLGIIAP